MQRKPGFRNRDNHEQRLTGDVALAWHVTMRLERDRVLAPTVARRRHAARILYEQGDSRQMLAFGIADTHIHVVLAASREAAGRFANYAETGLRWGLDLPVPFEAARFTPVFDVAHLKNATRYVVTQQARHTPGDDPLAEGSSLFDWLGMRMYGGPSRALVKSLLPRVTTADMVGWLGVPVESRAWAKAAPIRHDVWATLDDVAASAAGLATLKVPTVLAREARRAALHVGKACLESYALRELLELDGRTFHRWSKQNADPRLKMAIENQLRVRSALKSLIEATPVDLTSLPPAGAPDRSAK